MMERTYYGQSIKLGSSQERDGTWVCEYSIIDLNAPPSESLSGYDTGSFSSSDEAEAPALEAAHSVIDSSGPSDGPIS
ncbi:MAG: hypothetical protein H8K03_21545 [Nitrospira sp.]